MTRVRVMRSVSSEINLLGLDAGLAGMSPREHIETTCMQLYASVLTGYHVAAVSAWMWSCDAPCGNIRDPTLAVVCDT